MSATEHNEEHPGQLHISSPLGPSPTPDETHKAPEPTTHRVYRLLKTINIMVSFTCCALNETLIGPCMPDMRARLGISVEDIGRSLAARSIGVMVGSLLGGFLTDRYSRYGDVVLGVSLWLGAASLVALPWAPSVAVLGVLFFLTGMSAGSVDPDHATYSMSYVAAGTFATLSLWGKSGDAPIHAIHFGWIIGATLSPVLASSFLAPDVLRDVTDNVIGDGINIKTALSNISALVVDSNLTTNASSSLQWVTLFDESRVELVYMISGLLTAVCGAVFFAFCFTRPRNLRMHMPQQSTTKHVFSPAACADGDSAFGIIIVTLFTLAFIMMQGIWARMNFFSSFLREAESLRFSKDEAVTLDAVGRGSGIVIRVLVILTTRWICVNVLLFVTSISVVICSAGLCFFGARGKIYIWIFNVALVSLASPQWPGFKVWGSKYFTVTSLVIAITTVGYGITGFFYDWLSGYMYSNWYPASIHILTFICAIGTLLVLIALQIIASHHVKQKDKQTKGIYATGYQNEKEFNDVEQNLLKKTREAI